MFVYADTSAMYVRTYSYFMGTCAKNGNRKAKDEGEKSPRYVQYRLAA